MPAGGEGGMRSQFRNQQSLAMDKFYSNQYQQNYLKRRHEFEITKARWKAATEYRLKNSEEVFMQQGITFEKRRGVTWLVTIENEKFDYNAKEGYWKPVGKHKWYSSTSAGKFLESVRNFQQKFKKECSN